MQPLPLSEFIQQQNLSGLSVTAFLQQVTAEHPYFTPAHFFALRQMEEQSNGYVAQAAKTALLFNNPYWLQYQLSHVDSSVTVEAPAILPATENADNDDDNAELAITTAQPNLAVLPPSPVLETTATDTTIADENAINDDDTAVLQPTLTTGNNSTEHEAGVENDDENDMKKQKAPVKIPAPKLENTIATEGLPAFEPMHLVDYFASQGIKLTDEMQTGDKLGKQLKSFTEWLKTMKKLHPADTAANAGAADIAVQVLAAKSNKEGEIVTEALAEVLTQQGKRTKAIEIYEKLSLLNPAKSAFFAAKIEQLKGL